MNSESRKWNDSKGATASQVAQSELRRKAKERLKLPSFWVDKSRDGFTQECQELASLMNAGPCGTYRPAYDAGSAPDLPGKKRPTLGIGL